jgi:hypothetical protein
MPWHCGHGGFHRKLAESGRTAGHIATSENRLKTLRLFVIDSLIVDQQFEQAELSVFNKC